MIQWYGKSKEGFGCAVYAVLISHIVRLAGCWQPAQEPVRTDHGEAERPVEGRAKRTQLIGV